MDCHTLSKVLGRCRMVWNAYKCVCKVSVHCKLKLNTGGGLNVTQIKIWRLEVQRTWVVVPRKLRIFIDMKFSFFLCGEFISEVYPNNPDALCIALRTQLIRHTHNHKQELNSWSRVLVQLWVALLGKKFPVLSKLKGNLCNIKFL